MAAPIVVTHYTDPWSVWCWAIEPQLLRLRERHGASGIRFQVRLGSIHEVPAGPDFPREEIRRMFGAAKRASGMPLDPEAITTWPGTTHRAGVAAAAVRVVDPEKVLPYLRRMRFAAMVQARNVEDLKEQEALARDVGLDPAAFLEAIESDEATREFYGDQAEGRSKGVAGFPTVTFRNEMGLEVGVGGFQPTEAFEAALTRVAGARFVDEPMPELEELLARHPQGLATVEVAEVYDWLEDEATMRLLELEARGVATREGHGGGWWWRPA